MITEETKMIETLKKNYPQLYKGVTRLCQKNATKDIPNICNDIAQKVDAEIITFSLSIAEKFKQRRKELKLSMADLYKISGVSSSTINDIEKAKYFPQLEVILKLGYALRFKKHEIFNLFP